MNSSIVAIIFTLFSSMAMAGLTDNESQVVEKAVFENDLKLVKDILTPKSSGDDQYSCLLGQAIEETGQDNGVDRCRRTEIIKFLIEKGASPTQYQKKFSYGGFLSNKYCEPSNQLFSMVNSGCGDVVKELLKRLPSEEIAEASPVEPWKIHTPLGANSKKDQEWSATVRQQELDAILALKAGLEPICAKQGPASKPCMGIKYIDAGLGTDEKNQATIKDQETQKAQAAQEMKNELARQKAEEDFSKSPPGIKKQVCADIKSLSDVTKAIAREKKVTQESGIVNKSALYNLTTAKQMTEAGIAKQKATYKKLSGKVMDTSDCSKQSESTEEN